MELEELVKFHAGKGKKAAGEYGMPGYKERVDFGKIIGEYASGDDANVFAPTSFGMIVYDKNRNCHVWPIQPFKGY